MVKTKAKTRLPERPKPPTRDQIIEDFNVSKLDDVAFQSEEPILPDSVLSSDGETSVLKRTQSTEAVETVYNQVLQLIQMDKQLKEEPKVVEEKYTELGRLGDEVSDSISALRNAAAETVGHKT